jgi:dihydroorotase
MEGYDPNAKVNPPLRGESDRTAVVEGLADGTVDVIATDHAPHAPEEKDQELALAPSGLVGLETALALALTELVAPGALTLLEAVRRLSTAPARLLGLGDHGGPVAPGRPAHLVVFDPSALWTIEPTRFRSKGRNTPFGGRRVRGRVLHTFLRGRPTVRDGELLDPVAV